MSPRVTSAFAAAALLATAPALAAQTVTVTSPGVVTTTGARSSDAIFAPLLPLTPKDQWLRQNVGGVGATASTGVSSTYARSGNGSALMSFTQTTGTSAGKADLEYFFGGTYVSNFTLGTLTGASFDYFKAGTSTVAANQTQALRFYVDGDGDLTTTTDRGYLVYEPVYNGTASVATDVWNTATIGSTSNLWFRQFTGGLNDYSSTGNGRSLAAYQAGGYTPTGSVTVVLSSNSLIFGLSTGIGSGWTGASYTGAVDNVSITRGGQTTTFNFETTVGVTATPEPSTWALMGTGLLAVAGAAVRRRRAAA